MSQSGGPLLRCDRSIAQPSFPFRFIVGVGTGLGGVDVGTAPVGAMVDVGCTVATCVEVGIGVAVTCIVGDDVGTKVGGGNVFVG
jgi:hypothetical protein